jgi:hypothetical protein
MIPSAPIRAACAAALTVALLAPVAESKFTPRALGGSGTLTFDRYPVRQGYPSQGLASKGLIAFKEFPGRMLRLKLTGTPSFPLTQDHPRAIEVSFKVVRASGARGKCKVGAEGMMQLRARGSIGKNAPEVIFDLDDCGIHDGYGDGHGAKVAVNFDYDAKSKMPWHVRFKMSVTNSGARKVAAPRGFTR